MADTTNDVKKYLDLHGLTTLVDAIKDGTLKAGKAQNADTVPASGITGVIDISHIPHAAQERLVIVPNKAARLALTSDKIQTGDICKEHDTGLMYYLTDDAHIESEGSWEQFSAGKAVEADKAYKDGDGLDIAGNYAKKATTLAGYGIIDAKIEGRTITLGSNTITPLTSDNIVSTYNSTGSAPVNGKAITDAIDTLDGVITGNAGAGKTLTAFSQSNGKVTATFSDISITKSQVSDFPTKLPASDVTDTYSKTGKVPVSGTAVASAIKGIKNDSITGTGTGKTLKALSQADGVISAEFQDIEIDIDHVTGLQDALNARAYDRAVIKQIKIGANGEPYTPNEGGLVTLPDFSSTNEVKIADNYVLLQPDDNYITTGVTVTLAIEQLDARTRTNAINKIASNAATTVIENTFDTISDTEITALFNGSTSPNDTPTVS